LREQIRHEYRGKKGANQKNFAELLHSKKLKNRFGRHELRGWLNRWFIRESKICLIVKNFTSSFLKIFAWVNAGHRDSSKSGFSQ
jgi:hypothetical protein